MFGLTDDELATINRPKSFRTLSPSPEGEGWDEGKIECKNFWDDLYFNDNKPE